MLFFSLTFNRPLYFASSNRLFYINIVNLNLKLLQCLNKYFISFELEWYICKIAFSKWIITFLLQNNHLTNMDVERKHMKYPYTFPAKLVQFPYKFHWDNFWLPRFIVASMAVTFPFFLFIHRKGKSLNFKKILIYF